MRIKDQEDRAKVNVVADCHSARRENKSTLLGKKIQTNNISLKKKPSQIKLSECEWLETELSKFYSTGKGLKTPCDNSFAVSVVLWIRVAQCKVQATQGMHDH